MGISFDYAQDKLPDLHRIIGTLSRFEFSSFATWYLMFVIWLGKGGIGSGGAEVSIGRTFSIQFKLDSWYTLKTNLF